MHSNNQTGHGENRLVVTCHLSEHLDEARAQARRLGLVLEPEPSPGSLVLGLDEGGWFLQQSGPDAPGPIRVDFVGGAMGHRRRMGVGRRQPLARAVGIKRDHRPQVWDLTAGLGRDAFVLALLGCQVEMVERSAIVSTLLADGLRRAAAVAELAPTVQCLTLHQGDALEILRDTNKPAPEVIYLDPMYPERDKTALVKKEMRVLRAVVGDDDNAPALLAAALARASRRVVVKRPRRAPPITGPRPSHALPGKTTRFDIYLI